MSIFEVVHLSLEDTYCSLEREKETNEKQYCSYLCPIKVKM